MRVTIHITPSLSVYRIRASLAGPSLRSQGARTRTDEDRQSWLSRIGSSTGSDTSCSNGDRFPPNRSRSEVAISAAPLARITLIEPIYCYNVQAATRGRVLRRLPRSAGRDSARAVLNTATMPSGTLAISKTRTTPATFELLFVPNFNGSGPPRGGLTVGSIEELREILGSVGIGPEERDKAVREAVRDSVALLRDVVLTAAFIDRHRL